MKTFRIILLIILGILIGIILMGMYKFNYLAHQPGYTVDGNKKTVRQETIIEEELQEEVETMTIRIPDSDLLGNAVRFTEYTVPKSLGVLHASYEKLFELYSNESGYNGLAYDSIILDNGVARLFLSGSWYPAGDLSGAYMRHNINETAFQYDSVDTIEVYLNDNLFDWCIDSQADISESHCDTTPKFWIDEK